MPFAAGSQEACSQVLLPPHSQEHSWEPLPATAVEFCSLLWTVWCSSHPSLPRSTGRCIFHHSNLSHQGDAQPPKSHQHCDSYSTLLRFSAAFLNMKGKENVYTYNPIIHSTKITGLLYEDELCFLLASFSEGSTKHKCFVHTQKNAAQDVITYQWQISQSHQQDRISATILYINRERHTLLIKASVFCYAFPGKGLCLEKILNNVLLNSLHYRDDMYKCLAGDCGGKLKDKCRTVC